MLRNWCVWGLPRVLGAIRLAYPKGGEPVPEGLIRVIRIAFGFGNTDAVLEDGVLAITLSPIYGEKGCLYEHQLCAVILGEPILPASDEESASDDEPSTEDEAQA